MSSPDEKYVKVLEDEVQRLKERLYQAEKPASIGFLVPGVAHELNNPLTGAIARAELLVMKTNDETVRAELQKILDCAERCRKIIDNLLNFSRRSAPSKSLESVNDIIDRAVELRSYWHKSGHILIEREYDPASTVFADGQQLQQVVLNLLLNAEQALVQAGRTDGKIRFATRFDQAGRCITVRVIDNGPGIAQNAATRIFEPFFTTKSAGAGLGLSIAHGIVAEHGGTIRYEEADGGGAVFTVELPAASI